MTDRPILFSGPMVRALLAGTKTQTRRVIRPKGHASLFDGSWADSYVLEPGNQSWREREYPWRVGDRLYVREAWRCNGWASDVATFFYRAHERASYTEMCEQFPVEGRAYIAPTQTWKPGIHLPRWASRLTLTVTDLRVERLQEISAIDCRAEGHPVEWQRSSDPAVHDDAARDWFSDLWNSLNVERGLGWGVNPWVVAVTFAVERRNIDEVA